MNAALLGAIRNRTGAERATGRQFAPTRTSRKTVHFIPPAASATETVWRDLVIPRLDEFTMQEIRRHCTLVLRSDGDETSDAPGEAELVHTLLPPKKGFSIGMNVLFSDVSSVTWLERILFLEFTASTATHAESVWKEWPKDEEWEPIQAYRGPYVGLTEADTLFYVLRTVPRIKTKLGIAVFKTHFEERVKALHSSIDEGIAALDEICAADQFPAVIAFIYGYFHFMNHGRQSKPKATGFRLSWLPKIQETKSFVDKNLTLLDLIVGAMQRERPDLLQFPSQFGKLDKLAQTSHKKVVGEFQLLQSGMDTIDKELADSLAEVEFGEVEFGASRTLLPTTQVRAHVGSPLTLDDFADSASLLAKLRPHLRECRQKLSAFDDTAKPLFDELRLKMNAFLDAVGRVNAKFGEDPGTDMDDTVGPLDDFVQKFKARVPVMCRAEPAPLQVDPRVSDGSVADTAIDGPFVEEAPAVDEVDDEGGFDDEYLLSMAAVPLDVTDESDSEE